MAAQTQGAVDYLLGLLATAVQDEARLVGGVPGDMQFIKDEMDSMNGFLKHLNKAEEHDDQVRAWMKQVREIAYMSEDCVESYLQDVRPYYAGSPGFLWINVISLFLCHPKTYCKLHTLGKQIAELKLRVREVGERRQRYGVSVPEVTKPPLEAAAGGAGQQEEKRKAFRDSVEQALEEKDVGGDIVGLLHADRLQSDTVHGILFERCRRPAPAAGGDEAAEEEFRCCTRMFLCALYVCPADPTNLPQTLEKLEKKLDQGGGGGGAAAAAANRKQVMTFCYSLLSTQQKSCLQYVIAFLAEKEISRTSMVRRWVAEGFFAVLGSKLEEEEEPDAARTPEEEAERCFSELLLRGFIKPKRYSDAGSVKSCVMEDAIKDFLRHITESENFLVDLPAHLRRQLQIRRLVEEAQRRRQEEQQQVSAVVACCQLNISWTWRSRPRRIVRQCSRHLCCCLGASRRTILRGRAAADDDNTNKDPMDKLLDFLDALPEMYRLNVLDLGGCPGLKDPYYLREFIIGGKLQWLRYLSLRSTDATHLPARVINRNLTQLETLDIRETNIPASDTRAIRLPKLKHLLAGRKAPGGDVVAGTAVQVPHRTGSMRNMETLSHVEVPSKDGAELLQVARLKRLRKLGVVVVHGNEATAARLGRVLDALAACLRSLSVQLQTTLRGGAGALDISSMLLVQDSSVVLENLDIKGKTSSLPPWISRAQKLANIWLRNTEISGVDALRRLATVPNLRCLKLSGEAFTEQALVFKDVQFKTLKLLVVDGSEAITSIDFRDDDAAPVLEKIVWTIGGMSRMMRTNKRDDNGDIQLISGIQLLGKLEQIELRADFKLTTLSEWVDAKPKQIEVIGGDELSERAETTREPTKKPIICRFISSSDANKLIKELPIPEAATDKVTLSLPARVINTR